MSAIKTLPNVVFLISKNNKYRFKLLNSTNKLSNSKQYIDLKSVE